MYEIFGNFDSVEEINACAEGLKAEGDKKNLLELAKENGILEVFAEEYMNGDADEFTDYINAAIGKLEVEAGEYKDRRMPVRPVVEYLEAECVKEHVARAVRRRTKTFKGCMERIEKKCRELHKKTGVYYVADLTVFHWARDYFLED